MRKRVSSRIQGMEKKGSKQVLRKLYGKFTGKIAEAKGSVAARVTGITAGVMAMVSPAYCTSVSVDEMGNKVIKMLFNILFLGGVVFLANGIRLFVSAIQQGEQAPPGAIGKAIASILSGIVMMAMKALLTSMGVNVDNWGLFR